MSKSKGLSVAGLFAGIGGIELGLQAAGHHSTLLCEIDPGARAVLRAHFGIEPLPDVREIDRLDKVDLLCGGFPCQDLSQAGNTVGITGKNSGLVGEVLRLVEDKGRSPNWLLLENVSFMLQLHQGKAMRVLTDALSEMGFTWAYRVVDTRAFGLPQRRQRVILLASRDEDPRGILFDGNETAPDFIEDERTAYGFYWTEGVRGLGWGIDAIPTLKGGSTIGIPSSPAIWTPHDGRFFTPDITDAERFQGFEPNWTEPAMESGCRKGHRWKLVGNAVSVPVAEWVGHQLMKKPEYKPDIEHRLTVGSRWPKAAWGRKGEVYAVERGMWPVKVPYQRLCDFLREDRAALSYKAAAGFLSRVERSSLNIREDFKASLRRYVKEKEPK